MSIPAIVRNLSIPESAGNTNLQGFFPGLRTKVDPKFQKFVDGLNGRFALGEREGMLFEAAPIPRIDDNIVNFWDEGENLQLKDANVLCALLHYLANEGQSVLEIPAGEEEINVILGYAKIDGQKMVLFIEHELEHDEEEIHLHARPLNHWRGDVPLIIVVNPDSK